MNSFKLWMKLSSLTEKKLLARKAKTSLTYLYNLQSESRIASAEVAGKIELASEKMALKSDYRLPKIRRQDLAVACRKCPHLSLCSVKLKH